MATTFSSLPFVRRVAVGDCSTPQGADATAQLARSAFEALGGSDWTVDDSAPSIPVHEYKRPIPRGDAWKACYGYADSTRSQRSACGAVCYTFTLPADASTGSTCDVSSIAGSVVGDRYLDLGVDVHAVLSDSSTPPTVAELLARTADATVCATSSQAPTKPNDRTGVTATLDLSPSSAATRYLHIALLLHDYLGVRGAWIEGGALLDPSTVAVGFSRDVAADTPEEPGVYPLTAGKGTLTDNGELLRSVGVIAPHYRLTYGIFPRTQAGLYRYAEDFDDPTIEAQSAIFSHAVSRATISDALDGSQNNALIEATEFTNFGKVAYGMKSDSKDVIAPMISAVVRSGYLVDGIYRKLRVSSTTCDLPVQMVAYAITEPFFVVRPDHSTICDPAFWRGKRESILTLTKIADDERLLDMCGLVDQSFTIDEPTVSLPVVPLLSVAIQAGGTTDGDYEIDPLEIQDTGYPTTVLLCFKPNPGGSISASMSIPASMSLSLIK